MDKKLEIKIPENVSIEIVGILGCENVVNNIDSVSVHIDNKKVYVNYRINVITYFVDPIWFEAEKTIIILVKTKTNKEVNVIVAGNFIILDNP